MHCETCVQERVARSTIFASYSAARLMEFGRHGSTVNVVVATMDMHVWPHEISRGDTGVSACQFRPD
eukprot:6213175-Pleurochrysis_carterae.AAC.2